MKVFGFIVAITLVRVAVSAQTEIASTESYYWLYAEHPALGYYDHPPMIGWLIWLSTRLFGQETVGVRLLTILGHGAAIGFAFLAARRLYGAGIGRLAAFATGLVPFFFALGAQATPDAPLLLFWTFTLWMLAKALSGDGAGGWIGAGAGLGLTLLSKYHGAFLALGVLLFLIFSPDHRAWLKRPQPYVAAALALALFSPVLVWNARHGWQSFAYQGAERFEEGGGSSWKEAAAFPFGQLLYLTPVIGLAAWWAGGRALLRWRSSPWQDRLLAALGMPLLLFFSALLFVRSVRAHWTAPAYASLVILATAVLASKGKVARWLFNGSLLLLAVGVLLLPIALAAVPRAWLNGWSQLAAEVRKIPHDFVIARDYHVASQLAYHLRPEAACDFTAVGRPSKAFPHWWRGAAFEGRDAVAVYSRREWPLEQELVRKSFEEVDPPIPVVVTRFQGKAAEFLLVRARRFRGAP